MDSIIPIPCVNGAIFNEHREILLTRRSDRVREPGKWCLPGGHIEQGEDWLTAAQREIQEEVGIRTLDLELCGIYSDPILTVTQEPVSDGNRHQFVVALFLIRRFMGEINPNDEVDEWDWFPIDNLPDPMLKSHPVRIRDAFQFHSEVFVR